MDSFARDLYISFYFQSLKPHETPETPHMSQSHYARTPHFLSPHWSLKAKSSFFAGLVFASSVGIAALALQSLRGMTRSVGHMKSAILKRILVANELRNLTTTLLLHERDFIAEDLMKGVQQQKSVLEQEKAHLQELMTQFAELKLDDDDVSPDLEGIFSRWKEFDKQIETLATGGDLDAAVLYYDKHATSLRAKLDEDLDQLVSDNVDLLDEVVERTMSIYFKFRGRVFFAGVFLVVLSAFNALILRKLSSNITDFINWARAHSYRINLAADRISESATERVSASREQSLLLTEMSEIVEQAVTVLTKNVDAFQKADQLLKLSRKKTLHDKQSLDALISLNKEIKLRFFSQAQKLGDLLPDLNEFNAMVDSLSDKFKLVQDVVFQAKLHSFNLSVEASRGGDGNKIVAGLAEEAESLERLCEEASHQVAVGSTQTQSQAKKLISALRGRFEKVMPNEKRDLDEGTRLIALWNEALDDLIEKVKSSTDMVSQLTGSVEHYSLEVAELKQVLKKLDEITGHWSRSKADLTKDASDLSEHAHLLRDTVARLGESFAGNIGGERAPLLPPAPLTSNSVAQPAAVINLRALRDERIHRIENTEPGIKKGA